MHPTIRSSNIEGTSVGLSLVPHAPVFTDMLKGSLVRKEGGRERRDGKGEGGREGKKKEEEEKQRRGGGGGGKRGKEGGARRRGREGEKKRKESMSSKTPRWLLMCIN